MSLHLIRPEPDDLDPDDNIEGVEPDESADFGDLDFGDAQGGGADPLFPGDIGTLGKTLREALVAILKRRYISADRHGDLWRVVIENEPMLQSRLNDLFLELVIDRDYRVAYKRQATSETGMKFPTLIYDKEWNREETILLVFLRRRIRSDQKAGDLGSFVDRRELVEEVRHFRSHEATNQSRDDTRANNAIDALVKSEVLLRTDVADRYRLSTIIEVLLPVSRVKALAAWLIDQNDPATPSPPAETDSDPDGTADEQEHQ